MVKILVVEDEPMLREMYTRKLSQSGLEVISANDAEQGLKMVEQEKPDIILLDILLPKKNGIYVLEQLRSNPKTSQMKVIAFSNYNDPSTRRQAKELNVLDYLIKTDYTPQEIVKKIKSYL